ncbi:MAG: NTP transferase domain-containing protein [FCB group bacterium]
MISINKHIKPVSALILAAGESKRMNYPKSLLPVSNGARFIDKIIREFVNFGCREILVVINKNLKDYISYDGNIKIIVNENLAYERFYSIKIGLRELYILKPSTQDDISEFCFIHNVDNPFISGEILSTLYKNKLEDGYVFPTFNDKGGHPILMGKKIINAIISEEKNDLNFREFLNNYIYKKIELNDDSILININSMKDYNQYINI